VKAAEADKHCQTLRKLGMRLGASDFAIENAIELAEGYDDLAVLLLEPADMEATRLNPRNLHPTIKCVDEELANVCRTGNWRNTCIVDARPSRTDATRTSESAEERCRRDDEAYMATKQVLNMLKPDVLLICHCGTHPSHKGLLVTSLPPLATLAIY